MLGHFFAVQLLSLHKLVLAPSNALWEFLSHMAGAQRGVGFYDRTHRNVTLRECSSLVGQIYPGI